MSAAPEQVEASAATEPTARIGHWTLVFREFKRSRLAILGMWAIFGLIGLAVLAPVLSLNQPFIYATDGGTTFPWFRALFDRLVFENGIDIFFNLLLVGAPVYAGVYVILRKKLGSRFSALRGKLIGYFALAHVVLFLLITPQRFGPLANPLYYSYPVVNLRVEVEELERAGKTPFAVFPLRGYAYRETDPGSSVLPPSGKHWLGTDTEGRDVFARMLYGTRISLSIGVVAVALYVAIGVFLGAVAGYFGGWVDNLVSRAIEVMICFPTFFLILTLAALIQERSIFHVMFIIGITSWTGVARLVRAEFLKHKGLEYAQAARALGIPRGRIIFTHILPNAIAPVLVSATFGIASAILVESSLAFLGLGDITVASWGETLNAGRLEQKVWLILAPGFAIFFVVTIFNLVGEALRDALDPKLRS
jgi:peptide/nickel transport system permease protein